MDEFCRICREEATEEEPLYHPCKCSGSIRYVHQDCLVQWLEHSKHRGAKCDLCHTEYRFVSVYDKNMSDRLPVKAHLYQIKLLMGYLWYLGRFAVRLHIWVFTLVIMFKYVVETSVLYGNNCFRWMPHTALHAVLKRASSGRTPPFTLPWPYAKVPPELQHAAIYGAPMLAAAVFFFMFGMTICAWVSDDHEFIHEIEHFRRGEPGHLDEEEDADGEDENVLDANGVQLNADGVVAARNAQAADNFGDPDDPDRNGLGAFLRDLWHEIEDSVGKGSWGQNLVSISLASGIIVFVTVCVFVIPYATGRTHQVTMLVFEKYVRLYLSGKFASISPPEPLVIAADTPFKPENVLALLALGWADIVTTTYGIYSYYRESMLKDPNSRGTLIVLFQAVSTARVFVVVIMEMFCFPFYCGLVLHLALLPLMPSTSIVDNFQRFKENRYFYGFCYWSAGLSYMYLLSSALAVYRRIMRPGLFYFVQDPNDPRNEPVKNILRTPLVNHARKIFLSGTIYFGLITTGIGAFAVVGRSLFWFLFPINLWASVGPKEIGAVPFAILFVLEARHILSVMGETYAEFERLFERYLHKIARSGNLQSFLFNEHMAPEELANDQLGTWVRAPAHDYIGRQKDVELFPRVDADDKRVDGVEGSSDKELTNYTVVWRPGHFWKRICMLMISIWLPLALVGVMGLYVSYSLGALINLMTVRTNNGLLIYCMGVPAASAIYRRIANPAGYLNISGAVDLVLSGMSISALVKYIEQITGFTNLQPSHSLTLNALILGATVQTSHLDFSPRVTATSFVTWLASGLALYWRIGIFRHVYVILWIANALVKSDAAVKMGHGYTKWHNLVRDTYYKLGVRLVNLDES